MFESHVAYVYLHLQLILLYILFPDGFALHQEVLTLWLLGQVHVHVRWVPMSDLPQEANEISKWCHDAFEIKVALEICHMPNVLTEEFVLASAF